MRFVLLAFVVACHGPALPAVPGKGGPAWLEIESEHFTLWTDSSRARGRELIRRMEHLRQVVLGVGFSTSRLEGKSLVLALRDSEEVGVFVPEQFAAFASAGGAIRQGLIVLPADGTEGDEAETVTHELVHVISFNVIRNQPAWFAEGMANFFASVNVDPDKARGDVGKPLSNVLEILRETPPTPVARMFACKVDACHDDMFYATAWAMFSFLANTQPQELIRYSVMLDDVAPERVDLLFAEVFPQLTPEKFDHELRKWLSYGKHTVWKFDVKLQQWPVKERTLADADVYAARAIMRQLWARSGDGPPPELRAALAADPTHLLARLVEVQYTKQIDLEIARRIATKYDTDWRAWWLVGLGAGWSGDEARAAFEKACALLAAHPSAWAPTNWCKR